MHINGTLQVDGLITGTTTTQAPGDNSTKLATTAYADAAGGGSSPHALLDGTQNNDTVAQTPSRGSLIYGNATPKWDEKVIGGANTILNADGTDFGWTATPTIDTAYWFGRIIPASIAGNTNDYLPIDSGTSQSFHVVTHISVAATGAFNVTGFDEGTTGEFHVFTNRGTNTITFTHADTNSSVNNRIWCPNAANYDVTPKASVLIYYSQPDNKWVVVDSAGGSGITQLTGNVTAGPGTGSQVATIANSAVTLAKIANAAANSKLVGSGSSGSGAAYSEITLDASLSMSGTTLSVASSAAATVFMQRTVITDAQIKSMNSAPVTIITAPASNQFVMPISMVTYRDTTAGAYSASHNYGVLWNGLSDALITAQSLNMATAEKRWSRWAAASTLANTNDPHAKAVVLKDATADVTGGNASNYLVVDITYVVVTDGP